MSQSLGSIDTPVNNTSIAVNFSQALKFLIMVLIYEYYVL